MKKTLTFILAGALVVAIASCAKENDKTAEEVQPVSGPVTLSASIDNEASTKATLDDGTGAFAFSASDAIKVHNGTGAYTGTTAAGGATASFTMQEGFTDSGSGLAAFPADIVSEITAGSVTFILPTSYAYSEVGGSDASAAKVPLPMIATYTAGNKLSFKQAGSVVRIRVTNIAAGTLSFTFPSRVTGKASLTAVPSGDGEGILAANLTQRGYTITVTDVPAITSGSYAYITLPVPTGTAPQGILVVNNPSDASASRMAAIEGSSTALNRAGGYKLSASLSEVTTPSFKVSDTKSVVIAPGNLMAHVSNYSGGSTTAKADSWKFGGYFEYIGDATDGGNYLFYVSKSSFSNKWIDFFAWQGTSVTDSNKAHGLVNVSPASQAFHGDGIDESLYDGCWDGLEIANGGAYTWRPMTIAEWSYLLTNAARGAVVNGKANSCFVRATVAGVNGLLIFPDSDSEIWNASMGKAPSGINYTETQNWGTTNIYTASQFVAMSSAGIVFLPAAGFRSLSIIAHVGVTGFYWSSSAKSSTQAHGLNFNHGSVRPSSHSNRLESRSVRLVRDI